MPSRRKRGRSRSAVSGPRSSSLTVFCRVARTRLATSAAGSARMTSFICTWGETCIRIVCCRSSVCPPPPPPPRGAPRLGLLHGRLLEGLHLLGELGLEAHRVPPHVLARALVLEGLGGPAGARPPPPGPGIGGGGGGAGPHPPPPPPPPP